MGTDAKTVVVRANVEMTVASLQAIVANAKAASRTDDKGLYRIDTADKVSEMISRFLLERDFESFVENADNY